MSSEQSSNSIYAIDSASDYSESPLSDASVIKADSIPYSSGSSIELSGVEAEAETSRSSQETQPSISSKTKSLKSFWSGSDVSSELGKKTKGKKLECILPNEASPFIYDGKVVRYNVERGVDYDTTFLVGSRKLIGHNSECGYRPSHLVFVPKSGTLVVGRDVNNGWAELPKYSLITGLGNSASADASFISGAHNIINLEPKSVENSEEDEPCSVPSSCAIIGGSSNTITAQCGNSSVIIACSGIDIVNSQNTVVLGMKTLLGQRSFDSYSESTFTRSLYGLKRIHAGAIHEETIPDGVVLDVNGDALIRGKLIAPQISEYFSGVSGATGSSFIIYSNDGVNVVYANPINGTVNIHLGTGDNKSFETNRAILFKDSTLEFGSGSQYNVNIFPAAPGSFGVPTRIEYYDGNSIVAGTGGYSINSSGGAVTFRYMRPHALGGSPTWIIENQLVGNPRLLGSTGNSFIPASERTRSKIIHLK